MSWNCNEEKLLCHILLDDSFAKRLSRRAGPAFFRAFIVQNRASGLVTMKFRFHYEDDSRSWFSVTPKAQGPGVVEELGKSMRSVMNTAAASMHQSLPRSAVQFFYPPDDEGKVERTIAWLKERDLIEAVIVGNDPEAA